MTTVGPISAKLTNELIVDNSHPQARDDSNLTTPFKTLTQAISVAPSEAVIVLAPGVYSGDFVITDKSLTLRGRSGPFSSISPDARRDNSDVYIQGSLLISSTVAANPWVRLENLVIWRTAVTGATATLEIRGNDASGSSGPLVEIDNCFIQNDSANGAAKGIWLSQYYGIVYITRSNVVGVTSIEASPDSGMKTPTLVSGISIKDSIVNTLVSSPTGVSSVTFVNTKTFVQADNTNVTYTNCVITSPSSSQYAIRSSGSNPVTANFYNCTINVINSANNNYFAVKGSTGSLAVNLYGTRLTGAGKLCDPAAVYYNDSSTPVLLFRKGGINGKTVADTSLWTTPTGKKLRITEVLLRVTAASAITAGGTLSIGTNSSTYNNIFSSDVMTAVLAVDDFWRFVQEFKGAILAGGSDIRVNITGAWTGTSITVQFELFGIFD